eukprot:gnl/Chilomastix_cuspidata/431.p1 GENE.gnl/Chilomastix_cuspidata/431~~gnl/Chilomastix_cuspidata/431.p1  ORF type:complete len:1890 (-),score=621.11 gnl/Chilomastix_cuspidata/431:3477-9146(-)
MSSAELESVKTLIGKQKKSLGNYKEICKKFLDATTENTVWSVRSKAKSFFDYFYAAYLDVFKNQDSNGIMNLLRVLSRVLNNKDCFKQMISTKDFFANLNRSLVMLSHPDVCYRATIVLKIALTCPHGFPDREKSLKKSWAAFEKMSDDAVNVIHEFYTAASLSMETRDAETTNKALAVEEVLIVLQAMTDMPRSFSFVPFSLFHKFQEKLPFTKIFKIASAMNPRLSAASCSFLSAFLPFIPYERVNALRKEATAETPAVLLDLITFSLSTDKATKIAERREASRKLISIVFGDKEGLEFLARIFPAALLDFLAVGLEMKLEGAPALKPPVEKAKLSADFKAWGRRDALALLDCSFIFSSEKAHNWPAFWVGVDSQFNRARVVWNMDIRNAIFKEIRQELALARGREKYKMGEFPLISQLAIPRPAVGALGLLNLLNELKLYAKHKESVDEVRQSFKPIGILPLPSHAMSELPFYHPSIVPCLSEAAILVNSPVEVADQALALLVEASRVYPAEFLQASNMAPLLVSIALRGGEHMSASVYIVETVIQKVQTEGSHAAKKLIPGFLSHLLELGFEEILRRAILVNAKTCVLSFKLVNRIILNLRRASFRLIQPSFFSALVGAAVIHIQSDQFDHIVPSLFALTTNLLATSKYASKHMYAYGLFEMALFYLLKTGKHSKDVASFIRPLHEAQETPLLKDSYLLPFIPPPIINHLNADNISDFLLYLSDEELLSPEMIWNAHMRDSVTETLQQALQGWAKAQQDQGKPISFIRFAADSGYVVETVKEPSEPPEPNAEPPETAPHSQRSSKRRVRVVKDRLKFLEKEDSHLPTYVRVPPICPGRLDSGHFFIGGVYLDVYVKMPETKLKDPGVFLKAITEAISPENKMCIDGIALLFKHHGMKADEVNSFFGAKKLQATVIDCETDCFESVVQAATSVIGAVSYSADDFGMGPHVGNLINVVESRVLDGVLGRCMDGESWELFDLLFTRVTDNVEYFVKRGENKFSDLFVERCLLVAHTILAGIAGDDAQRRKTALSLVSCLVRTDCGASGVLNLRTLVYALEAIVTPEKFFPPDTSMEIMGNLRIPAAEILLYVATLTQEGAKLLKQVFPMGILRLFDADAAPQFVEFLISANVLKSHTVWDASMFEELCAAAHSFVERVGEQTREVLRPSFFTTPGPSEIPSFHSALPKLAINYTRFNWEVVVSGIVIRGFLGSPGDVKLSEKKDDSWALKMLKALLVQIPADKGEPVGDRHVFSSPPEDIPRASHILARGLCMLASLSPAACKAVAASRELQSLLLLCDDDDLDLSRSTLGVVASLAELEIPEVEQQLFTPCWVALSSAAERFSRASPAPPRLENEILAFVLATAAKLSSPSKGSKAAILMLEKGFSIMAIRLFLLVLHFSLPGEGTEGPTEFWPMLDRLLCHFAQLVASLEANTRQRDSDRVMSLISALVSKQFAGTVRGLAKETSFAALAIPRGEHPPPAIAEACAATRKLLLTPYKFEPVHFWTTDILQENISYTTALVEQVRVLIRAEFAAGHIVAPDDEQFRSVDWKRAAESYVSKSLAAELMVEPGVFPRAYLSHPHQKGFDRAQFFTGLCKYLQRITTSISQSLVDSDTPDKVAKDIADIVIIIQALEQLLNFSPDMLKNPLITKVLGNLLQFTAIIFSITHPAALEFAKTVETSALRFPALSNPLAFEPSALEPVRKNSIALINRFLSNPLVLRSLKRDEMLLDLHTILLCAPKENCRQVVRIVKDAILKGTEDGILLPAAATSLPLGLICSAISFEDNEARENAIEALVPFLFYCEESGAALRSCLPEEFLEVIEQTAASVIEFIDDMEFGLRKHIVKVFNERCFMHALGVVPTDPRSVTWDDLRPGAAFDGSEDEHSD